MAHMAGYDVVEEEVADEIEIDESIYCDYICEMPPLSDQMPFSTKFSRFEDSFYVDHADTDSTSVGNQRSFGSSVVEKQKKIRSVTVHKCQYCNATIKHPSKIEAHLRTHTGEKPFECGICGMRFTQRTPMRMHVRRHVGDAPFQCAWPGCGRQFVSNALRNAHQLQVHVGKKRKGPAQPHLKPPKQNIAIMELEPIEKVESPRIDREHVYEKTVSKGASRRLEQVIEAVACGRETSAPKQSRRRPALVAQCQQCGILLKHPSKITAHMRTHTGERPFECGVCGMRFSMANPLRIHLRRAHTGEKPFECTWECGKKFVSKAARNEHERIVHAGVKRYQCRVEGCLRLFTRRRYLIVHEQRFHEESERRAEETVRSVVESVLCERPSLDSDIDGIEWKKTVLNELPTESSHSSDSLMFMSAVDVPMSLSVKQATLSVAPEDECSVSNDYFHFASSQRHSAFDDTLPIHT